MSVLKRIGATSETSSAVGLLVLRLWFGIVLAISHGWGKMLNVGGFAEKVAAMGLPAPTLLAFGAAASELVGGLLLTLGLLTRPAALAVLVTMLVAAFEVHAADPFARKELALAFGAAALCLLIAGPGKLSVDRKLFGR